MFFADHYWRLQLDDTTGMLLQIERRNSNLIENIHDGSILDRLFGSRENLKINDILLIGDSLPPLIVFGFWIWYGPKRLPS